MPDSFVLTGPAGTALDIGTWVDAQQGPDFGEKDLLKADYAENPQVPGGILAYESAGVRRMSFPLILPSQGAFGGLDALQGLLRRLARPGATLDLIPDGVATANAVRYDVNAGRLEPDYNIWEYRADRLRANLRLDCQPFGYLPTWITLASAASVGMPGVLTIPNASLIGDWPGLGRLVVEATVPTQYGSGTWLADSLVWSMGARASFRSFHSPSSFVAGGGPLGATHRGNTFAPTGVALELVLSPTANGSWLILCQARGDTGPLVAEAIEPAYRGRFRAFSYVRFLPSQSTNWNLSLDAVSDQIAGFGPLASAAPVATVVSDPAGAASPGFQLVDLGELTLPPVASGLPQSHYLRVWGKSATSGNNLSPSPLMQFGGLFLTPLAGAGFLPRSLVQPSVSSTIKSFGRLSLDAYRRLALIEEGGQGLASSYPITNGFANYRGDLPQLGFETLQLDLTGAAAASGATSMRVRAGAMYARVSVQYRPRFFFLKSI